MKETVFNALKNYVPPEGWGGHLFLLPEQAMKDIHSFIVENRLHNCIELGTGFGATTCMIADAVRELEQGQVITIDKWLHQPVNVKVLMAHVGLPENSVEAIADELGYNWYLAEVIAAQTKEDQCTPLFDFCLLDGAHEWAPDALAFFLIAKLLKPGAWIVVDDLDFNLRMIPNWRESHGNHTDRELDDFQMRKVFDLVVRQHPDFTDFKVTHNGRIGWARKKFPEPLKKRWFNLF